MSSLPRLQVAEAPMPEELGRYRLIEPLGAGGVAVVYRAYDPALRVERAIKVLHREAAAHPALRQRFLTEASTLTRLVHPNVLRIYEVGEEQDHCWYAMDLVEEGTAQRRLEKDGPFAPGEAVKVIFQVLQALGAAHKVGIVHRDVKPQNILLRADGTALLADFGSARQAVDTELTRTGDVLGTIGYMAPEQRNDARAAGPAADMYAVGASLFGLLTGRAPLGLFEGEIDGFFLAKLHPALREVLRTATRYQPGHRYVEVRAMALDLARAYDQMTGTSERAEERWVNRFDALLETFTLASLPPGQQPAPVPVPPPSIPAPPKVPVVSARHTGRGNEPRTPLPIRRPTNPEMRPSRFDEPRPDYDTTEESDTASKTQKTQRTDPRGGRTPLPDVKRSGTLSSLPWFLQDAVAAGRSLLESLSTPSTAAEAATRPAGVWEGRLAGMLPLRVELEITESGEVTGWVVTTGMRGQVITRIEGRWNPGRSHLDLEEISERPDRGRYSATLRGNALEGSFNPEDPASRPLAFTLTRSERAAPTDPRG